MEANEKKLLTCLAIAAAGAVGGYVFGQWRKPRSECQREILEMDDQYLTQVALNLLRTTDDYRGMLARYFEEIGCTRLLAPYEHAKSPNEYDSITDPALPRTKVLPIWADAIQTARDENRINDVQAREIADYIVEWATSSWRYAKAPETSQQQWLNDSGMLVFLLSKQDAAKVVGGSDKIKGK